MMMKRPTIKEVKAKLQQITDVNNSYINQLAEDERVGVKQALMQWHKKQANLEEAKEKLAQHLALEQAARHQGYQFIAGVDEVGRGPLAGPVVAAAVILPANFAVLEVNDSKQLSDKKRLELYPKIIAHALAVGFGVVDAPMIDAINIYEASRVAMKQAVEALQPQADYLLIDAMVIDVNLPQEKLIKGDARSASIGAASILAKVKRDQMMLEYAKMYPGYQFEKNMGYGTQAHLAGLAEFGVTPIHRQTFAPIKNIKR